jgi:hypothetical protein
MPIRARRRARLYWPYCQHWAHWHPGYGPYGPPPPWSMRPPSPEDEKEALLDYIEMLQEELADAEAHLKELEQEK